MYRIAALTRVHTFEALAERRRATLGSPQRSRFTKDAALDERADGPALAQTLLEERLARFKRGRRFISQARSVELARELDAWLGDVETQLVPAHPAAAWSLVDRFIRADHAILLRDGYCDDSIFDAFRRSCVLWHRLARQLPADPRWVERVHDLYLANGCDTRGAILSEAPALLAEIGLRRLARLYAKDVTRALRQVDYLRALVAGDALRRVDQMIDEATFSGASPDL